MKEIVSSAPGKIIITGEHSIVHGEPALLATLGLRTKAKVIRIKSSVLRLFSDKLSENGGREEDKDFVLDFWRKAKRGWEYFDKTGDSSLLDEIKSDEYVVMICSAGLCFEEIGEFDGGIEIELFSDLPIISGFGSSAYVAASIIGAIGELFHEKWSLEEINKLVYKVEKIMHGRPSGGDPTVIVNGGFIKFQRANGQFKFEKLDIESKSVGNIYLINSGKSVESTGEMVGLVSAKCKAPFGSTQDKQSAKCKRILRRMGRVTERFVEKLLNNEFDASLLQENERLLEELGVVGKKARRMIQLIEEVGGVAKISGGGGVKKGSGVILAYHENSQVLEQLIEDNSWENFSTTLGGAGWKIE